MFDKIVFISDHTATIKLKDSENITMNLMNLHLVFEDDTKKVLGEEYEVVCEYLGKDLEYREYEQLMPILDVNKKAFYTSISPQSHSETY